jgi:hypothetical protein
VKIKNPLLRKVLFALAVVVFGFILLNLTFIFDAVYQGIIRRILGMFLPLGPDSNLYWFPAVMHVSFAVLILIISFFILKSALRDLFKAVFFVVPLAVTYVTIGMFLYQWPFLEYTLAALTGLGVLYGIYRTKQPWLYYFSFALVSLLLLIMALFGVDI